MRLRTYFAAGLGGLALALLVDPALAQTAAPAAAPPTPVPNKGDTAWMLVATCLVLMMSIPGLALFYGGLVRTKNMLSLLTQVFAIVCLVCLIWVFYGYSLSFTNGGGLNDFVGGFSKAFLRGVTPDTTVADLLERRRHPGIRLHVLPDDLRDDHAGADRRRLRGADEVLGARAVHGPVGDLHLFPDRPHGLVLGRSRRHRRRREGARGRRRRDGEERRGGKLAAVKADAGLINQWGGLDFAGGTVVHINAGIAGLVGCLIMGKRIGYGRDLLAPHSLTMTMIGGALLWVGWFGFNAGSNLEANGTTALAMVNTFVATAAAALSWLFVEWGAKGKPSLLGMVSGAVAGLVAVTPASGFAGPMGSIVLGLVAGATCFVFCSTVKNALGYDDSLDVFGIHCVGGILGALATGILVNPWLGGAGIPDYEAKPGELALATYEFGPAMINQIKAVLMTLCWSGIGSAILYKVVDVVIGLRVTQEEEREGLDLADHGERAYNY